MSSNQPQSAAPQPPEENSKMDALVKVVLVFFISLLSFSVGTFVGKQVSDSDHRRASLEGEHAGREVASTESTHEEGEKHSEQAVEDLASEFIHDSAEPSSDHAETAGEEEVDENGYSSYERKDAAPEKSEVAHEAPKEKEAAKPTAKSETLEAAKKISKGEVPTSGKTVTPPRKPSNALPAVASSTLGKYTVQVASYGSEGDAKQYASHLKERGWNAFYIPADIKGRTWYRVSVGLFEESSNAQDFMKQFLKESGAKDALVVKIVQ